MSEYDQMQEQKRRILERDDRRVFEAALAALKAGAPGLSDLTKEGIACNIVLRLSHREPASTCTDVGKPNEKA